MTDAPALGYVRPVEGETLPLDSAIQRTAIRACALGEGIAPVEVLEEAATGGRTAFHHLLEAVSLRSLNAGAGPDQRRAPTVIVATLRVLGETALERTWRLIALQGQGARLLLTDGAVPEDALREAWTERPLVERRRERTRESMRARALRGMVLGRPPFGYAVQDRTLVPDAHQGPVVRRMFREYVDQGEGFRRIAAGLNRDGIQSRLGRPWTPGAVRTVLRNPVYTGLYRRLGVAVPASHPALIDRATFHAAQRMMALRRTSRSDQQRHEYLFSGLLRCGQCRGPMSGERRALTAGEAVGYRCLNASARGTCSAPAYREAVIERAVREELTWLQDHSPVAVRDQGGPDPAALQHRHERRLAELAERWLAGEWRFSELVARAAAEAEVLCQIELPPEPAPVDTRTAPEQLAAGWDEIPVAERRRLLRATVAEIVVDGDDIRVSRRR